MPWLIALAAGIVCAIVGVAFSAAVSDLIIRAYRIPSFEGASGYFVLFVLLPIGAIVGFVSGFAVLKAGPPGLSWVKFVLAPLVTVGLLTIGYGIAYLTVDRPPRLDGHTMTLELEVRLPASAQVPEDFRDLQPRISLYASNKDNRFVTINYDAAGLRDGRYVVPCEAPLMSARNGRTVLVGCGGESSQVFTLGLRARPTRADSSWTEWRRGEQRGDLSKVAPADAYEVRYRVRVDG